MSIEIKPISADRAQELLDANPNHIPDESDQEYKYAGLTLNELKRLRSVEEENRRLKQIVAQQALDNWSLKELLAKNF